MPSAGALYPLELYVLVRNVASLTPGIYRYQVGRHELLLTKPGYRPEALIDATSGQDWSASAPACISIAAVFERTAAKYGDRGHRYVCLEAGHAAENLMLQASRLGSRQPMSEHIAMTKLGASWVSARKKLRYV